MNDFTNVPGYRVESLLGEGGMAKVYLAIQESLERQVALKVMNTTLASDQSFCERFLKEGKIIAQLSSHPDIVTIFDIGFSESNYYMAMEYVSGPNLKDLIQKKAHIEQPLNIIKQIASALGYAHRRGFIHRDVKPANILFKEDGTATLTDFGIAKALSSNTQLTKVGYTVGTAEYMSPEQAVGRGIDSRSDIYSLGVVLYELLSGKKPFIGEDPFSTALMHATAPVPKLPKEFGSYQILIEHMLAKDPDDRFDTAEQLIQQIDSLTNVQTRSVSDRNTRTIQATQTRSRRQTRSQSIPLTNISDSTGRVIGGYPLKWRWWTWIGFAVAATVIVVYVLIYFAGLLESPVSKNDMSPPTVTSEPPDQKPTTIDPKLEKKISLLLEVAEAHFAVGRLTAPPGSNAYEAYEMVLEIDPGNQKALEGLRRLDQRMGR